jgi:hypothetical protein
VQVRRISGGVFAAIAPLPARAAFKITEDESPRPQDRAYLNYNLYYQIQNPFLNPGGRAPDLHREMLGLEKTFLDGNASIGLRLPYLELTGNRDIEDSHISDLSVIFKYAFINDRTTGNVLSGGMVVTAPTGQELQVEGESSVRSTVLQPWVGYIYNVNRSWFLQGFSSLAVPTDARDVTLLFNDIGVGYRLYRSNNPDSWLTGIVPVSEIHVNTPLNHRGLDHFPLGFQDSVNYTGGAYFYMRKAVLGIAFGRPLTGPKPYDFEINTTLGWNF